MWLQELRRRKKHNRDTVSIRVGSYSSVQYITLIWSFDEVVTKKCYGYNKTIMFYSTFSLPFSFPTPLTWLDSPFSP